MKLCICLKLIMYLNEDQSMNDIGCILYIYSCIDNTVIKI